MLVIMCLVPHETVLTVVVEIFSSQIEKYLRKLDTQILESPITADCRLLIPCFRIASEIIMATKG